MYKSTNYHILKDGGHFLGSGDINLAVPPSGRPPYFQEDELFFELFCNYMQKTCVIAIMHLYTKSVFARRRREKL